MSFLPSDVRVGPSDMEAGRKGWGSAELGLKDASSTFTTSKSGCAVNTAPRASTGAKSTPQHEKWWPAESRAEGKGESCNDRTRKGSSADKGAPGVAEEGEGKGETEGQVEVVVSWGDEK